MVIGLPAGEALEDDGVTEVVPFAHERIHGLWPPGDEDALHVRALMVLWNHQAAWALGDRR